MVVIALGSNLGDRIHECTRAYQMMIERGMIEAPARVSKTYTTKAVKPETAPDSWDSDFLNVVIQAKSSLEPEEFLRRAKEIEKNLGRQKRERWAPREIDIDILFWNNRKIESEELQVPHPEIANRHFWLWSLQDLYGEQKLPHFDKPAAAFLEKFKDSGSDRAIDWPLLDCEIAGILNVTPDSFSDGRQFESVEDALAQTQKLVAAGASIIDIGAESTRPGAMILSDEQEWSRLENVLPAVSEWRQQNCPWVKLSIDTRKSFVASRAIEMGYDWINDVSAGEDPGMLELLQRSSQRYVFMHHLGIPADKTRTLSGEMPPLHEVGVFAEQKKRYLISKGVNQSRLIFDPGIGFGKTAWQSVELMQNLSELHSLGLEMMVGHSRKSFLNLATDKGFAERDLETAVLSTRLQSVDYIRVHDPETTIRAIKAQMLFVL